MTKPKIRDIIDIQFSKVTSQVPEPIPPELESLVEQILAPPSEFDTLYQLYLKDVAVHNFVKFIEQLFLQTSLPIELMHEAVELGYKLYKAKIDKKNG